MTVNFIQPLCLLSFLYSSFAASAPIEAGADAQNDKPSVQVQEIDLYDDLRARPVKLTIWYPPGNPASCHHGLLCLSANARLDQGVILTHGAMGSARDYNWIGYAMASQGIVAVGINHFGESWVYGVENTDPKIASQIWLRAEDIVFALDRLAENALSFKSGEKILSAHVNRENVTVIGHSSGGSTAIALAGGEYDFSAALDYCISPESKGDLGCAYLPEEGKSFVIPAKAEKSFRSQRIKRIIALDPALGHLTTEASLKHIEIPALIIGSRENDFLPFERHSAFYGKTIPKAKLVELTNREGHFVYMDECSHSYKARGVSICEDRPGVNRKAVHEKLYPDIFKFIYQN